MRQALIPLDENEIKEYMNEVIAKILPKKI
jgi:hypothetical protein